MPSTVIRAAHYHPDSEVLDITFTTGRRYLYRNVPEEEANRFRAAFSKGRYFNAHIRDRYDFTEVASAGS
jgi:lysyl-tRNA synthetase class 2